MGALTTVCVRMVERNLRVKNAGDFVSFAIEHQFDSLLESSVYHIEGNFGGVKLWRNATRNPFGEINFGEFTDHTCRILIALNFRIRDPYYARVQPVAH